MNSEIDDLTKAKQCLRDAYDFVGCYGSCEITENCICNTLFHIQKCIQQEIDLRKEFVE